jgi:hypothetical protein
MQRRNEICFCGSGRRFKHCHGALSVDLQHQPIANWHQVPQRVRDAFNQNQLTRLRHFEEVGSHRPPLIAGEDGNRFIIRGNALIHWKGNGSFLNFLETDLLHRVGEGSFQNANHPLHNWHLAMRKQAERRCQLGGSGGLSSTVAVLNFFTVAYDLFVVSDNADLRERLLKSLRVAEEFHGARYELMIAACLLRGGFAVEFSNENELDQKHIDAIARHTKTGREYHVEMKAKGREGIMGKRGDRPLPGTMSRDVSRLLRDALCKPADGRRLVFIDMNLPPAQSISTDTVVWWQQDAASAVRAVEDQPGNVANDTRGFVVFTNSPAHYMQLEEYYEGLETAFTGFRIPNFAEDMPLLRNSFPDIADLFEAFHLHDIIPDQFPKS